MRRESFCQEIIIDILIFDTLVSHSIRNLIYPLCIKMSHYITLMKM